MHPAVLELKQKLLDRYGDRLVRFIVFGSYARGDAAPDSDIDILITMNGPVNWDFECEIIDLAYKIELEKDVVLDVKVYSDEDVQQTLLGATPFIENVMNEGMPL
ncbi:MAG: nucleotidyltransferase domain-containing protein [Candidatus Omnitrophota bacterium]